MCVSCVCLLLTMSTFTRILFFFLAHKYFIMALWGSNSLFEYTIAFTHMFDNLNTLKISNRINVT